MNNLLGSLGSGSKPTPKPAPSQQVRLKGLDAPPRVRVSFGGGGGGGLRLTCLSIHCVSRARARARALSLSQFSTSLQSSGARQTAPVRACHRGVFLLPLFLITPPAEKCHLILCAATLHYTNRSCLSDRCLRFLYQPPSLQTTLVISRGAHQVPARRSSCQPCKQRPLCL